jgi:TctA family transporter
MAKSPERFGRGAIEGVAAPEAATHSAPYRGRLTRLGVRTAVVKLGHYLAAGALAMLEKPFQDRGLVDLARSVFDGRP